MNNSDSFEINKSINTEIRCLTVAFDDTIKEEDVRLKSTATPNFIQSHISNIVFPKTLDEVWFYATDHGCFNVEDILTDGITTWTVPNWTKIGDVVFFMHSKTSKSTITALKTQLEKQRHNYSNMVYRTLEKWLDKGMALYNAYGGKIFAIGKVVGAPRYISDDDKKYEQSDKYHWKSRIYADIELFVLEKPIDISSFNDFISVSRQGAITGVWGNDYSRLIKIINANNDIPPYYKESVSSILPISQITKNNWLDIGKDYRRNFVLEAQFRQYYVNYLLRDIGDQKKIYAECRCIKRNHSDTFVDNMVLINKKYLPVEVKLSVESQKNINKQVNNYCNTDYILLDSKNKRMVGPKKLYNNYVLVIDTDNVFLFNAYDDSIKQILTLDELKNNEDIKLFRQKLISIIQ